VLCTYFTLNNQRAAALNSLYSLPDQSTSFERSLHPRSAVHKTVVTTTGTSHAVHYNGIV